MRRKVEAKPGGVNVKSKTTARSRTKQPAVSGNTAKLRPKADRSVAGTRNALGDALVALMQEKPFDDITVQHVLDRAGVGRSTFYEHYRDKNDLFLSDVDQFGEHMAITDVFEQEAMFRSEAATVDVNAHDCFRPSDEKSDDSRHSNNSSDVARLKPEIHIGTTTALFALAISLVAVLIDCSRADRLRRSRTRHARRSRHRVECVSSVGEWNSD